MLSRLPYLLAVSAIVSLAGCFAAAPEIQTITERVYIPCPLSPPPGECPDWLPLSQPVDMLESSADALVGARILDQCKEWIEKQQAADRICREKITGD